jgi:hypothetical protein
MFEDDDEDDKEPWAFGTWRLFAFFALTMADIRSSTRGMVAFEFLERR